MQDSFPRASGYYPEKGKGSGKGKQDPAASFSLVTHYRHLLLLLTFGFHSIRMQVAEYPQERKRRSGPTSAVVVSCETWKPSSTDTHSWGEREREREKEKRIAEPREP